MGQRFLESLRIGETWETKMEDWMQRHFAKTNWTIHDTRDIHRDSDDDQIPDYVLHNTESDKACFIDAKKRNVYRIRGINYFGFDEKFYTSYTNIARKCNTKVYVGFNDPIYDSDHVYILDMDQIPSLKLFFDNEHGRGYAYRWRVEDLAKYKI